MNSLIASEYQIILVHDVVQLREEWKKSSKVREERLFEKERDVLNRVISKFP